MAGEGQWRERGKAPMTTTASPAGDVEQGTTSMIELLRDRIDQLDDEIIRLISERVRISRTVVAERLANGGPRVVHSRELVITKRYTAVGDEGGAIAMALLRLGRGR
jgi:chorismate mutase